ncbi:MAG: FtsW/RodA/SpoVE family cell cycle protein [Thermotogae bacterium]|nr:FtsW/RodA/SpoVE family cell cycle protein [Thermotogota bacterium]
MKRELVPFYLGLLLAAIGLIALLPDWGLVLRQVLYNVVGIGLFFYVGRFNVRILIENSKILYLLTLLLLILVLFFGGGAGVRRWFSLGFINLQPSELAKVTVPVFLMSLDGTLKRLLFGLLPWGLILIEPDLATSSVILILTLYVVFITAKDLKFVLLLFSLLLTPLVAFSKTLFMGFVGVLVVAFGVLRASLGWVVGTLILVVIIGLSTPILWSKGLKEYQRRRILALVDPRKGGEVLWQTYQSRIALANAGPFGKGVNGATQKNYGFLPAAHTDFAFTSIVEVSGYVVGFLTLILLFALPFSLVYLSISPDSYLRMVASTAGVFFLYQTTVNLLSVLGYLPIAGIPLPFITYGGSHLLTEWIWLGLVWSAYRWRVET